MKEEDALNRIQSLLLSNQDNISSIEDLRNIIKSPFTKENPLILIDNHEIVQEQIKSNISHIQSYLDELFPFILKIKEDYIEDITEETTFCAVYLLMRFTVQNWSSVLSLAKQGDYGSLPLIRISNEAVDLATLFVFDHHKGEDHNLMKWFGGKIIKHEKYRKKYPKFFNKEGQEATLLSNALNYLHQTESLATHPSYINMIQNISPLTEDFDTSGMVQYSRVYDGLSYVLEAIRIMNTSLKLVYKILLKDLQGCEQLSKIKYRYDTPTVE